jgi:hypothetical protein
MDLRALINKMDQLSEAEDPTAVIAKYTEMGKKPTADMPAFIDPKDGKVKYMDKSNASMGQQPQIKVMPSDWIKRYAPDLAAAIAAQGATGSAYGSQEKGGLFGIKGLGNFDKGTSVNTQQATGDAEHKKTIAKAKELITKIKAEISAPKAAATSESLNFKGAIARQLAESFGYQLVEGVEEAKPLMAELGKIVQGFGSTEDEEMLGIAQQYSELQNSMNKTATTSGQTATPAPGQTTSPSGPSTQDLTTAAGGSGEVVGKSLQRFKELLAKATGKPVATAAAGGAPAATNAATLRAAQNQASGSGPLSADTITANARPKTENMSEAEKYAALRDRLEAIESRVDEGPLDLVKGAYNVGKNFFGGLGGKMAQGTARSADELATAQAATNAKRVADGKKALSPAQLAQQAKAGIGAVNPVSKTAKVANRAGTAIRNNPGKTMIGATAAGAALGYGLSGSPETPPADTATPVPAKPPGGGGGGGGGGTTPAPTTPASTGGLTPEEMKELDALAQSYGDSMDDEIVGLMSQYSDVKNALLKAKK